jgi:hypothetical protein
MFEKMQKELDARTAVNSSNTDKVTTSSQTIAKPVLCAGRQNHLDSPLKISWTNEGYKVNKLDFDGGEFIDKQIGVSVLAACHNAILEIRKLNNPLLIDAERELEAAIDLLVGRE